MNQTEAYLAIYPDSDYDSARANASRLIASDNVQEEILCRLKEKTMSADEVLARFTDEAKVSVKDFLIPGTLDIDTDKVHELGYLVKSITHTKYGPKIELHDAQSAKVHLGKAYGIFSDNISVKVEGELEKLLDTLQSTLDADTYNKVVEALADD